MTFEEREVEKKKCTVEAVTAGAKSAAFTSLFSTAAVAAANQWWPAFRKGLGVSGKTALIISLPIGMFYLETEHTMIECTRRRVWRE